MQFEASRLSDGNKLFPAKIIIETTGVTLKVPGLFSEKEQTIPFHLISSVKLKTPFIGFSTIVINSSDSNIISASGFTADDAELIKKQIEKGQEFYKKQRATSNLTSTNFVENNQPDPFVSEASLSKWQDDLLKLSELTDDEVITVEEFESQKSILLLKLSKDSSLIMADTLRMLKDLEEDEVITEIEFNETKQNLMKPKSSGSTTITPIIETITPEDKHPQNTATENSTIIESNPVTPQTDNQEPFNNHISSSAQNIVTEITSPVPITTEQIDKLIEMALMDGILTEKEKKILFKKAEAAGIDLDEFEMILDAKLFQKQQRIQATHPPVAAPKSDKYGDVKKCPACGAIIQSFSAICTDCGHNFTNVNALSSLTKLYEQLQIVEIEERNRTIDSTSWIDKLHGSTLSEYQVEERILKRKASVVSSFPVPNTKEDIIEFLSMAVPEVSKKPNFFTGKYSGVGALYNAWQSKAEQVIIKARFSLKEDKKLLEEINNYAKELEINK